MDLNKIVAPGKITLRVTGTKADGTVAELSAVAFSIEFGTATVAEGPDQQSKVITVMDANPTVVRVDANADLSGGTRIITARLFLNGNANIPSNEAISLTLTAQ